MASEGSPGIGSDGGRSDRGAAEETGGSQSSGARDISTSVNPDVGTMSSGLPLPESVASSPSYGVGDPSALCSAEPAAEDDGGQAAGNLPAASAAMDVTVTRMVKKQLATYKKGPEDEQPRNYCQTRLETGRICRRDTVDVKRREAKTLTNASRRGSALPPSRSRRITRSEIVGYTWRASRNPIAVYAISSTRSCESRQYSRTLKVSIRLVHLLRQSCRRAGRRCGRSGFTGGR